MDEDMPYRPDEDEWVNNSDGSDTEGAGLVKGGALEGRAATRGTVKEKGEGYLGNGLGIQPRRRANRLEQEDSDEDQPIGNERNGVRGHSLAPSYQSLNGHSRSPSPARLLREASSRMSPGLQAGIHRSRQPSARRTIVTNLLHAVVEALRIFTELLTGTLKAVVFKPIKVASGLGKSVSRRFRQDWWKVLSAVIALSLALRLLNRPATSMVNDDIGASFDNLQNRLAHLESTIAERTDGNTVADRRNSRADPAKDLLDRVARLEASLASHISSNKPNQMEPELQKLSAQIEVVSSKIGDNAKAIASAQTSLRATNDLAEDLRAVTKRVDKVEDQMRAALDDGRLRQAIERVLPESMPIKRTKGGRIDVEPVFWAELKRVLVGKDEMDKAVQASLAGLSVGGKSEKELDQWGERLFATKADKGLIITRDQFLQAMNNELEDLKLRIDQNRQTQAVGSKPSSVVVKNAKGDDLTPMLQQLVDAAIVKYSKDTLAKPDYALFTAGARVIPSITSDTFLLQAAPRLSKLFLGARDVEGRSPATALHPDNSVGSCWPFRGDHGQLGVLLSRRVVVSDITIEHAAKDLSPDISTAPKAIEVVCCAIIVHALQWQLPDHFSGVWSRARQTKQRWLTTCQTERRRPRECPSRPRDSLADSHSSSSIPPSSDHILLASIDYDPHAEQPIQTFPVPPVIIEMGIDMGIVIVKVESNWGGDLTCLYRVSVAPPSHSRQ